MIVGNKYKALVGMRLFPNRFVKIKGNIPAHFVTKFTSYEFVLITTHFVIVNHLCGRGGSSLSNINIFVEMSIF